MNDKETIIRCRNLINEHEELLLKIIEEEEQFIGTGIVKIRDNDPMNLIKKITYQQGIIEGMKRLLSKIYKKANAN